MTFSIAIWWIWHWRNKKIYLGKLLETTRNMAEETFDSRSGYHKQSCLVTWARWGGIYRYEEPELIGWNRPAGQMKFYTDSCSKGNPGFAYNAEKGFLLSNHVLNRILFCSKVRTTLLMREYAREKGQDENCCNIVSSQFLVRVGILLRFSISRNIPTFSNLLSSDRLRILKNIECLLPSSTIGKGSLACSNRGPLHP